VFACEFSLLTTTINSAISRPFPLQHAPAHVAPLLCIHLSTSCFSIHSTPPLSLHLHLNPSGSFHSSPFHPLPFHTDSPLFPITLLFFTIVHLILVNCTSPSPVQLCLSPLPPTALTFNPLHPFRSVSPSPAPQSNTCHSYVHPTLSYLPSQLYPPHAIHIHTISAHSINSARLRTIPLLPIHPSSICHHPRYSA
jgi:hypothetical protein